MSVAEILTRLAENAGRKQLARGAIIGDTVAGASAIPAQMVVDRERKALVDQENARQNEALRLRQNEDTRQAAGEARTQTGYLQNQEKEQTLRGIIEAGFQADPNTFDDKAAIAAAQQSKYPELVTTIQDIHAKLTKPVQPITVIPEGGTGVVQHSDGSVKTVVTGTPKPPTTAEIEAKAINIQSIPPGLRTPEQSAWFTGYQANNPAKFGMTPAQVDAKRRADRQYDLDVRRYNFSLDPLGMYGAQTPIPVPGERGTAPAPTGGTAAPPAPTGGASPYQGVAAANTIAGLQGLSGQAFIDKLSETRPDLASEIKSYAEGRRAMPTGVAGYRLEPLIRLVTQYDPTFDATNYNARNKARADLTSPNGTGGKTINALNTAVQHAGVLSELIEKEGNTEYPIANWVKNSLGKQFGSTKATNFEAVQPQLMKEIERLWRGAGGSQGDIDALKASLGSNLGHQQQVEGLAQFVSLIKGKLDSTEEQRDVALGPHGADIPVIYDKNKPILDTILKRAGYATAPPAAAAPAGPVIGTARTVGAETRYWNGREWSLTKPR
jgi:hypothetical protein